MTHAVHDHRMTLSEEERKILSNKNISAIIQGIGKDKEPLVSFLEPKNKNFQLPLVSTANLIGPGHSFFMGNSVAFEWKGRRLSPPAPLRAPSSPRRVS